MTRPDRLRRTPVRLAYAALLWERAAPVLAGPALAFGLYLALALFGVFERTGDPVRALALLCALIASGVWLRFAWPRFAPPTVRDAERRVEADSKVTGRPYEALRDQPAQGDAALWSAHRARMAERLNGARARRPQAAWARLDAYGARVSLLVVILAGAFLAGDLAWLRVSDAFAPRALAGGGNAAGVEFWVEPPAYTGRPVIYLRDRRSVEAPEGSIVAARVTGLARDPAVSGAPAVIEALSEDVRQVMFSPAESAELTLRSGALRERVAVTLIPDAAPRVRLAAEPEGDAQGRLILEFTADDDYGVEQFVFEYAEAPADPLAPFPSDGELRPLSPGEVSAPDADGLRTATIDVARSTLAGERVMIRMAAIDGAGQRGVSGPMTITLPERVFLDPLAKAVADERRRFVDSAGPGYEPMPEGVSAAVSGGFMGEEPERRIERAPARVQRLALALDAFSDAPPAYFDDPVVWMGLRAALNETRRAREIEALGHLDEDLWQIALRAELGSLADAEAALRAAERALQDALARGADAMELSALMDAYEEAVSRYMQLLAREAVEEGRVAEGGGGGMGGLNADMLQQLIDALREAAELGDAEGSREALARLQELLENMQMTLTQGGEGGGQGEESAMARALREALEELSEAIGEQRSVMEDTFNQQDGGEAGEGSRDPSSSQSGSPMGRGAPSSGETGEPGEQPGDGDRRDGSGAGAGGLEEGEGEGLARRQQALAEGLEGLAESLPGGEGSEAGQAALDAARDAMEAARRALEAGDREGALAAQDEALGALRDAARGASERYQEARGGEQGQTDPLGRGAGSNGAGGPGTETGVPSESERQRAREVLEELRRRAAERGRPQEELDYIDRLLERF